LYSAISVGAEDHSKETIKIVKARGCELLPVIQLPFGADLRGFDSSAGISV
jgi:hypothetical protein